MNELKTIKNSLVVSCQALSDEPLHSSFIMGRMARAAVEGGAKGIRANSVSDIKEIKQNVEVPIIGIIKKDYEDSSIYITPTMDEVDALVKVNCDIIAMDATDRTRPGGISLKSFFKRVREKYPDHSFMADCSTVDEMKAAEQLGFDFIGSTLVGYTKESEGKRIEADDFYILRKALKEIKCPIIAEGNIDTPRKAKRVLELGCFAVVVGGAITRPQLITKRFVECIESKKA